MLFSLRYVFPPIFNGHKLRHLVISLLARLFNIISVLIQVKDETFALPLRFLVRYLQCFINLLRQHTFHVRFLTFLPGSFRLTWFLFNSLNSLSRSVLRFHTIIYLLLQVCFRLFNYSDAGQFTVHHAGRRRLHRFAHNRRVFHHTAIASQTAGRLKSLSHRIGRHFEEHAWTKLWFFFQRRQSELLVQYGR